MRWRGLVVVALALCLPAIVSAQASGPYAGKRVADALRALQAGGLRVVFSSEIVTPDMRVASEPRGRSPREVLDALLKPHALVVEEGPGGVLQVVRARAPQNPPPRREPRPRSKSDHAPSSDGAAYSERVIVQAPDAGGLGRITGSGTVLGREQLYEMRSVLADDPVRAVHALPRVAAPDDFRSEFSVRGSPYRHVATIIDGIASPWLQHSAYGRNTAGSIAMIGGDVVDTASLQAGAYPQRYGDRIGAQLSLTLREGSRTDVHFRGTLGGASASLVGEGPIGGSRRGSWLVAMRHSYLDWPVRRNNPDDPAVFGFSDLQSKFVYDVSPGQQIAVSLLAGRANVDGSDDSEPARLANGRNRAGAVRVAWRSTIRDAVVTHEAYVAGHEFLHKRRSGQDALRGGDVDASYRLTFMRELFNGLLETGGQVQRTGRTLRVPVVDAGMASESDPIVYSTGAWSGSTFHRAGYANYSWRPRPHVTIASGIRLAHSTTAGAPAVGRWLLGEWTFRSGWTMTGSTGVSCQFPDLQLVLGTADDGHLRAERATHAEIGVGRPLPWGLRWQATLYDRRERDVLRAPDLDVPFAGAVAVDPQMPGRYENAMTGRSRGVELQLERRSGARLTGWVAYAYATSRQTDMARQETFWSDFDQRHALKLFAHYSVSDRTSLALTFRSSTSVPIPGYVGVQDGRLVPSSVRNGVRLPGYARLDFRAERRLRAGKRSLTVFGETLNLLNRRNLGFARGSMPADPRDSVSLTEPLLPRLLSAGLRIDF